jgi:hypothetical protein
MKFPALAASLSGMALVAEASSLRGLQGSIGHSFGGGSNVPADSRCKTDSDCPTIQCLVAPCDTYICVDKTCTLELDRADSPPDSNSTDIDVSNSTGFDVDVFIPCKEDWDCPVVQCIWGPCDSFYCIEDKCILVLDRTKGPPEGDSDTIDVGDNLITVGDVFDFDEGTSGGEECGPVMCDAGETCCNRSCGKSIL